MLFTILIVLHAAILVPYRVGRAVRVVGVPVRVRATALRAVVVVDDVADLNVDVAILFDRAQRRVAQCFDLLVGDRNAVVADRNTRPGQDVAFGVFLVLLVRQRNSVGTVRRRLIRPMSVHHHTGRRVVMGEHILAPRCDAHRLRREWARLARHTQRRFSLSNIDRSSSQHIAAIVDTAAFEQPSHKRIIRWHTIVGGHGHRFGTCGRYNLHSCHIAVTVGGGDVVTFLQQHLIVVICLVILLQ